MKGWNKILLPLLGGMGVWLVLLIRHEGRVRQMMRDCGLPCQGLDWEWVNPPDIGQNTLFSIPYPRNLRTGEVIAVPFMGLQ